MSKENAFVSVIVPVYNVEKYIKECIESILRQTYTNYELLLVNDGSLDSCGSICDAYKKMDPRIKVIHKENGGLSDARNAGLKIAKGDYITFIDSDDVVDIEYLEILVKTAVSMNADIVQGEFTQIKNKLGNKSGLNIKEYTRSHAMSSFLRQQTVKVNAWAKLYKKNVFYNVKYPKGRINEDNLTTYKNIWNANKIVCVPQYIYYYRINQNGIMNSKFSPKRFEILSFKNEIEQYLGEDAKYLKKEIEYCEMRIAVRLINDCIVARMEKQCFHEMQCAKAIVKAYPIDRTICELKYQRLVFLIKINYWFYKNLIYVFRKR